MSCCLLPNISNKTPSIFTEHVKDPKYKTEMCKNWEKSGSCPYNNKCRFAHGRAELMAKEIEANPNYRARDCLNFFKYGFCNYGRRCCFRHDERRVNETLVARDINIMLKLRRPEPVPKGRLTVFREITCDVAYRCSSTSTHASSVYDADDRSETEGCLCGVQSEAEFCVEGLVEF